MRVSRRSFLFNFLYVFNLIFVFFFLSFSSAFYHFCDISSRLAQNDTFVYLLFNLLNLWCSMLNNKIVFFLYMCSYFNGKNVMARNLIVFVFHMRPKNLRIICCCLSSFCSHCISDENKMYV